MFPVEIYRGSVARVLLVGVVCSIVPSAGVKPLLPYGRIFSSSCTFPGLLGQSVFALQTPCFRDATVTPPVLLQETRWRSAHNGRLTFRAYHSRLLNAVQRVGTRRFHVRVSFHGLYILPQGSAPSFGSFSVHSRQREISFSGQRAVSPLRDLIYRMLPVTGSRSQEERVTFLPSASGKFLDLVPHRTGTISHFRGRRGLSFRRRISSSMSHSVSEGCCTTSGTQEVPADDMLATAGSIKQPIPLYGSGGGRMRISALLSDQYVSKLIGEIVTVCGWSRSIRKQGGGSLCFLVLSDGSGPANLQVVVESSIGGSFAQLLKCGVGCSFRVTGEVVKSPAKGQAIELNVRDSQKDASKYPLAKKEHTREYLREIAHLRPRTQFIGAVTRVRSHLAMATHRFFQDRGFLYIHTPIITAADCEGAGETFQVTTLLPAAPPQVDCEPREDGPVSENSTEVTETAASTKLPPTTPAGEVDFSKDFFGGRAFLTVSGQLNVEPYCCALGDVYTFGPTFRAENSHTSRHLAEFWMVEPEIAFATLEDNMNVAQDYVKYCVRWVVENCRADIEWFEKNQEQGLLERLDCILAEPFVRVTYTDAIELLKAAAPTANFKEPVSWGMDLGSEHERYLTEKIYRKPCIVYDYPMEFKAFYMKLNKDGKTVRAMDLLVPKIGELVGGSQREDDLERLDKMILTKGLDPRDYWWYRELRSYGSVPHAGFGLGFERLVMLVTGIENIRDTIPYPRYPGHAEY